MLTWYACEALVHFYHLMSVARHAKQGLQWSYSNPVNHICRTTTDFLGKWIVRVRKSNTLLESMFIQTKTKLVKVSTTLFCHRNFKPQLSNPCLLHTQHPHHHFYNQKYTTCINWCLKLIIISILNTWLVKLAYIKLN